MNRAAATRRSAAFEQAPVRPLLRGLRRSLGVLGPGLITGASDDDPSGIGTYSQVGSQFGLAILWTAPLTFVLMAAVQELCGRIALQTGLGLGAALRRKFPTWMVGTCIAGLCVANTVNLGADLAAVGAGVQLLTRGAIPELRVVVPVAALVLAIQSFASYRLIFQIFKWLTPVLFAYVITTVVVHPQLRTLLAATFVPHVEISAAFAAGLVAVLGTTISPYLFFWQASAEIEEKRQDGKVTPRSRRGVSRGDLRNARADILVGMFFSQVVMYCIIATTATVLHAHGKTGIPDAATAAAALRPIAGNFSFVLFAGGLIGTGMLAIPILSASAAYALKEFWGLPGNLDSGVRSGPVFYIVIVLATAVGTALNFLGVNPIQALFWSAVINGLVAPPLLVLIALLGTDRTMMGTRASGPWSRGLTWTTAVLMSIAAFAMAWLNWLGPLLGRLA